jgi:DNA-directed RNA polymerase specialized sigma24 family protein
MLRAVGERPFKEIAKIVGKSVGTVHAVYQKAIAKLAKRLGKE